MHSQSAQKENLETKFTQLKSLFLLDLVDDFSSSSIHSCVSKYVSCSGKERATVMNTNDIRKNMIRFKWKYPQPVADGDGVLIKFVYSVVQTYDTFWLTQQLGYLKINPGPGSTPGNEDNGNQGEIPCYTSTTAEATSASVPPYTTFTSPQSTLFSGTTGSTSKKFWF